MDTDKDMDPTATTASNDNDDSDNDESDARQSLYIGQVLFVALIAVHLGYLVYYYGYVWLFTKFQYDFTGWVPGPSVPAQYIDERYGWQWGVTCLMMLNFFPPLVGIWTLLRPTVEGRFHLHLVTTVIAVFFVGFALLWFFIVIWIFQNNSSFYPFSIANSVNYCCKLWGAVAGSGKCHNIADCIDLPTTPTIYLRGDFVFGQHLWSQLTNLGLLLLHWLGNYILRQYMSRLTMTDSTVLFGSASSSSSSKKRGTSSNKGLVTALHVINILYFIVIVFYLTFGLLTLDVRHTHEFPPTGPVGIRSARGSFESVGMIMSASVILIPALVLFAMLAEGKSGWLMLVFVLMILFTVVHLFSWMTMILSRGTANRPGFPNSLANHPLRCCAPDTMAAVNSECDNTALALPCTLPIPGHPGITTLPASSNDVPANPVHTFIFIAMFFFLVMDATLLALVFVAFLGSTRMRETQEAINEHIGAVIGYFSSSSGAASSFSGNAKWPNPSPSSSSSFSAAAHQTSTFSPTLLPTGANASVAQMPRASSVLVNRVPFSLPPGKK